MSFPKEFLFSTGTSAYQIEGAWNKDGRGESIWDQVIHTTPSKVKNNHNADIACDSYNLYKDDIKIIKDIGFNMYRFSISWTRILPNGEITNINKAGIDYYHNVIDELLQNGIEPMVTIYHWDLPQALQVIGGWANPLIVDYVEDYADLLFDLFGKKVKWWITINEPREIVRGYESLEFAPCTNLDSPGNYIVGHNALRAHGRIYRLYDRKYRAEQKGKLSTTLSCNFFKGKTNSEDDIKAANRSLQFNTGWFAHPIYSKEGDYPKIMREVIDENSKKEGKKRSRLPTLSEDEIKFLKGSFDFFALNHYSTFYCGRGKPPFMNTFHKDTDVTFEFDPSWPSSTLFWLKMVPWGIRGVLRWIKDEYNNPPVFITENGFCDHGELNDTQRISYHREYLKEVLTAMKKDECNVIGYTAWSIIDNFEWLDGYDCRFGLVHVDFNDPGRKRTPKSSVNFFKQFFKNRVIPE